MWIVAVFILGIGIGILGVHIWEWLTYWEAGYNPDKKWRLKK